ncbi:SpoVA/SpoVAEb family sporulation membrane protein, partial [Anoxybacillus sp.]|uniref:SpoVA/SpoVAEb family sporulation membrane protein n=1 Tax=Anoxybacillus sp. TaxID=1872573 RepID=UPI002FDF65AE
MSKLSYYLWRWYLAKWQVLFFIGYILSIDRRECMLKAFLAGGLIAIVGQALHDMYSIWFHMNEAEAIRWMNGTLIVCAALCTPTRLYRRFTQ